jgi:hypothetical protein
MVEKKIRQNAPARVDQCRLQQKREPQHQAELLQESNARAHPVIFVKIVKVQTDHDHGRRERNVPVSALLE